MATRRNRTTTGVPASQSRMKGSQGCSAIATMRHAIRQWRLLERSKALHVALEATKSLRWSPQLLDALLEELYVDESLEKLLRARVQHLRKRRYAEALAVALILRHSWRPDDLACIVERLGLTGKR